MKNMISVIERDIKSKSVLVVGDFFLDKYIYMKDDETGKSLYSYGPAYKIEKTVCSPGAAGTVVKNFANLGYEAVYALGIVGEDGDGYSLRKALRSFPNVTDMLISVSDKNTPSHILRLCVIKVRDLSSLAKLLFRIINPLTRVLKQKSLIR